jgi:hypothetical protein
MAENFMDSPYGPPALGLVLCWRDDSRTQANAMRAMRAISVGIISGNNTHKDLKIPLDIASYSQQRGCLKAKARKPLLL